MLKLGENNKNFVETIGNPSRLKILLALWKSGQELRVYKICRFTGLGRSSVRRHLEKLVGSGLVSKKTYGAIALYSINNNNPKANALARLFKETGF